ncbi:signal peptide peptidase SppA [Flavobacterium difficile]|uniref:Signal peptide peptidase SppA n=1 Tax=Flavobacterium difficile TaxID=2709659 RepID=A0ABX0I7S5_9FLAO|nr:signal peptide peptidase SppA [Flavobacterium difficile]NHM01782.1 signal peptide peptidase SppA [Flavobacterium difficile]
MNFFKSVFATVVGIFLFMLLSFFLLIGLGALLGSGEDKVEVKDNSVIELDLAKINFDYAGKFESDSPFSALMTKENIGFIEVLKAIDAAKTDDKIKGITIVNNQSGLGLAQSKELRDKLEDFKKSKKFVYAYANIFSQKEYYINSVADAVYLNPAGEVDFKGLGSELLFFKNFQDQTGLKMEIIRHGKFKSAVEPYLAQEISPENREQMTVLLQSVWQTIVTDIAKNRKVSVAQLNTIADGLLARTPQMALQQKLVDKVAYVDEFDAMLKTKLKVAKDEEVEAISISDYVSTVSLKSEDYTKDDIIAVIYAQGEITGGEGDVDYIGEGSINRSLKEAREDKDVKAIVLRVDSPGGSALVSELIWREIELTKKVKPVVVSMGNLAASGGYYIACNANTIFAEPTTITGSIGVFGMLPNAHGFATKYGVNAEQVQTHKNAIGYSVFEPISEEYKAIALEGVDQIYKTFVNRVAVGRKMTFDQVDAIAQGRVWTGSDAIKNGLVDKLGNLDAAIAHAAGLGKTKSYRTENYPEYKKNFNEFLEAFAGASIYKSKETIMKEELGEENYNLLKKIKVMQNRKGVQMILPFDLSL